MQQEKKLLDMSGPSSGHHSNSRWNPTKEQINLLEGMYRQGIRTPSAEQIQQITNRLKAFGHIEGKNVFYWFQNHKARQRQKQKQETMVYLNPLLHKPAPIMMPSPCTNGGVYSPYCMPPPGMTFYAQYPKVLLPGSVRSRAKEHTTNKRMRDACGSTELVNPIRDANDATNHETLQLFPLHPTRILEGRSGSSPSSSSSSETYDLSPESTGVDQVSEYQPFFDFFSPHASCETADR